jgi:4-aminobutyrate aminotransferase-like enzyme
VIQSDKFNQALKLLMEAIGEAQRDAKAPMTADEMQRVLGQISAARGREAFYPYLGSGIGRGARAMLADGRWILDFALGIGVHFFGHGNLDLIETAIRAAASDIAMQGNLVFNLEYHALMRTLLKHAPTLQRYCWLSLSGADANENALKLARQKREGKPAVIAFSGCFHGRTTTMAEITDRSDYRKGQPQTFPVHYVPFFDRDDPNSAERSLTAIREVIKSDGDSIAAFFVELIQGEGGFITAPRSFFVPLFKECRAEGIPVVIDEVQTFARTSELFATDLLNLAEYADIITIGKIFQGSAVIFRSEFLPDPGLISGTFSGGTVQMAVARRIIEKLTTEEFFGPEGRIRQLETLAREHVERLAKKHPGKIAFADGVGAMVAFRIGDASKDATIAFVKRAFDAGLALYYGYGGDHPACIRMFLPAGCLTDAELAEAFEIVERCL